MTGSAADRSWPELHRARRVIVVTDLVESVRLMQEHEDDVIDRWRHFVAAVRSDVLPAAGGRLVKSLGDGMLMEFERAPAALAAALHMQRLLAPLNEGRAPGQALRLRIGVHEAAVVLDELDMFGAGVNVAARLAGAAPPGDVLVSAEVRDKLADGIDADFIDLGDLYLKHLDAAVRAYAAHPVSAAPGRPFAAPAATPGRQADDMRPTITLLPLVDRDPGGDHAALGDLIIDELTIILSKSPEWRVISKLSASAFAGRPQGAREAGAALGARFVVSGALLVRGDAVRVQLQAVDALDGEVLWADGRNARLAALLDGSDELYLEACLGIGRAVFDHGVHLAEAMPLPQLGSHALLLGGVALMHRLGRSDFDRARQMIEHLQERHPLAVQPHAWRAKWHVLRVVQGWSDDPARDSDEALAASRRATDSDRASALAFAMQGLVQAYLRRDFDAAGRSFDAALAINPSESFALLLKGTMHAFLGDGVNAYPLTQQALRLSPLDPMRYYFLSLAASAAISAGRHDEAIELAQRSLKANRTHLSSYRALAIAQSLGGRLDDARRTVARLLEYEPGFTVQRFLARYPGRDQVPEYARRLADSLAEAGLPRS